ncbi:hypothetical protein Lal_00032591 [Lupinus albus]|nr:hypothetical protein Lal_00032591 [Lupinus albus]
MIIPLQFQGGFTADAANEWVQSLERIFRAMGCGDVQKVTYASYMLPNEAPNDRRNRGYQGSKPTVGGFQLDSYPLCSKCGSRHMGIICPDTGNGCFHCK